MTDMTDAPETSRLGLALRNVRKSRELTLKQVSQRTGLALSTLSKVENGLMSLTYDKLMQLASGLGLEMTDLFVPPGDVTPPPPARVTGRRSLSRPGSGEIVEAEYYTYDFRCTELLGKKMIPMLGEVRARTLAEFGPLLKHAGEEYFHVLSGRILVHTEFYAPELLQAGEGIYLDSTMGHAYLNAGDEPARCLCVCSNEGITPFHRFGEKPA